MRRWLVRRWLARGLAASAALTLAGAAALAVAPAAAFAAPCAGVKRITDVPWAQKVLSPERVWPHATGAGVTVAVIDSGGENYPQRGSTADQVNLLAPAPDRCVAHGTEVASLINARSVSGVGFRGVAPGARVLPIRVSDRRSDGSGTANPADFAEAIRVAADGASVINISMEMRTDDPRVRAAIADAIAHDVVVVAAAGNSHVEGADPDLPTYPAAYPGVVGVGAIAEDGSRLPQSQVGPYVDLVAPGAAVVVAEPVGGHAVESGTSYAAAFVSATVALVRDARPELKAADVVRRILATTTPTHTGSGFGAGLVNPYRAVVEQGLVTQPPRSIAPVRGAVIDPSIEVERARWDRLSKLAGLIALAALVGVVAIIAVARVTRRGRQRRWRPGRAPEPVERDEYATADRR